VKKNYSEVENDECMAGKRPRHDMTKTLIFFPREKPLLNFQRYLNLDELVRKRNILVLCNSRISAESKRNYMSSYSSNWTNQEETLLFDILYLLSSIRPANKALRHFTRVRLVGPEVTSLRNLKALVAHFLAKVWELRILPRLIPFRKDPQKSLKVMRSKGLIGSGDTEALMRFLRINKINKVIIATTLKDSQTYDMLEATSIAGIPVSIMIDSWDNIGCAAVLPKVSGNIYLWSQQQIEEICLYYPDQLEKCIILGSPRSYFAKSIREERERNSLIVSKKKSKNILHILYIQAYFYDDTISTLVNLGRIMQEVSKHFDTEIDVCIRRYPLIAPSHTFDSELEVFLQTLNLQDARVCFRISSNSELKDDLISANKVVSEISTGGLESLLADIPTTFVFSKHRIRYINGDKILDFKFAADLFEVATVVEGKNFESLRTIMWNFVSEHFTMKARLREKENQLTRRPKEYLASEFKPDLFESIFE